MAELRFGRLTKPARLYLRQVLREVGDGLQSNGMIQHTEAAPLVYARIERDIAGKPAIPADPATGQEAEPEVPPHPLALEVRRHYSYVGYGRAFRTYYREPSVGVVHARPRRNGHLPPREFTMPLWYETPNLDEVGNVIPGRCLVNWQETDIDRVEQFIAVGLANLAEFVLKNLRTMQYGISLARKAGVRTVAEARRLMGDDPEQPLYVPASFAG